MNRKRILITVAAVSVVIATPVNADTIPDSGDGSGQQVLYGGSYAFLAPNPPYDVSNFIVAISLGYGDPSNTIGDDIWLSGTGTFDLSSDPDYPAFLAIAQNGQDDNMTIQITDLNGYSVAYEYWSEGHTVGSFPSIDLHDYDVLHILMNVQQYQLVNDGNTVQGVIAIRWDSVVAPEPHGLLYIYIIIKMMSLCHRYNRNFL